MKNRSIKKLIPSKTWMNEVGKEIRKHLIKTGVSTFFKWLIKMLVSMIFMLNIQYCTVSC